MSLMIGVTYRAQAQRKRLAGPCGFQNFSSKVHEHFVSLVLVLAGGRGACAFYTETHCITGTSFLSDPDLQTRSTEKNS